MSNGPSKKIVARTLFHSTYVTDRASNEDAVVVSEMVEFEDGRTVPNLRVIKNPQYTFWVTQEGLRDYTEKKEFSHIQYLDEITVPAINKDMEIFRTLNGYMPNHITHNQRRELYRSPYLYGANISMEALVAMEYKRDLLRDNRTPHQPTTGFFDIEQSLIPSTLGALPLMVFTAEDQVFLAMKKSFMYAEYDKKMIPVTLDDIKAAVAEHIEPLIESIFTQNKDLQKLRHKLPFSYHYFEGDTELDMLEWITDRMHESKVTFIGVWNLGFDIGEILKLLEKNNVPLERFFAHPKVRGTKFAQTTYKKDNRDVAHFSQKWNWLSSTAIFQFIDSMALYSYIRQVDGKEASYALDYILKKFGIGGKLKIDRCNELEGLQEADWHRAMLGRFFVEYAVYAMWDGISLQILEWLNNDLTAMMLLGDTTPPKFFPNQTIRVTNTLFQEWKPKGYILGTGVDVSAKNDEDLLEAGGAVLQPRDLIAKGLRLFEEFPSHATHVYAWANDFDFSAQYPTNTMVLNIARQTKVSTIFEITGSHIDPRYDSRSAIEALCSYLITPNANGVNLGVEFFNLPSYAEMDKLFAERNNVEGTFRVLENSS